MARIDNFLRDIVELERRVRKLETVKQPLGGDVVRVGAGNVAQTGQITVAAGNTMWFYIHVTPSTPRNTLYNLLFSIYVDTDNDTNYHYPFGASLSAGQRKLRLTWWCDQRYANMTTGYRRYPVVFENYDTSSHNYYFYIQLTNIATEFS